MRRGPFHAAPREGGRCHREEAPAARALTSQRLHEQLRLLGVHVVLRQRVDVREDEPHGAQRGAQLPQRVCPRLLGLRSKAATRKLLTPSRLRASQEKAAPLALCGGGGPVRRPPRPAAPPCMCPHVAASPRA